MSTVTVEHKSVEPFKIEPITYPIIVARIEELANEYLPLTIAGVEDRQGIKAVHDARMHVRSLRVDVEKRRKELKASSLEYGRKVDAAAKELTELMEPIETHLDKEEERINQEKERLRKEKAEAARAATQARIDAFLAVGRSVPFVVAEQMTEEDYAAQLAEAAEAYRIAQEKAAAEEAERKRLQAEEDARRKAEAERLATERAELEAQRKAHEEQQRIEREKIETVRREQEAEQARQREELRKQQEAIDAEKRRLAEAEAKRLHEVDLERARVEAAEKAKAEEQARQKREAEESKARAEIEEARRLRAEALRPDKEKLIALADQLAEIEVPNLSEAAQDARIQARQAIVDAADQIRYIAADLEAE